MGAAEAVDDAAADIGAVFDKRLNQRDRFHGGRRFISGGLLKQKAEGVTATFPMESMFTPPPIQADFMLGKVIDVGKHVGLLRPNQQARLANSVFLLCPFRNMKHIIELEAYVSFATHETWNRIIDIRGFYARKAIFLCKRCLLKRDYSWMRKPFGKCQIRNYSII